MEEGTKDAKTMEEKLIEEEEEEEAQAETEIWRYIFGFTNMAVVKCAIDLGIADAIEAHGGRPVTLSDLSSTLGCSPPLLHRIMRFLVHQNFFKEKPTTSTSTAAVTTTGFVNSALSRLLLRKKHNSMADFILLESSRVMLAPWLRLSTRVRAPTAAGAPFEEEHGGDVWKYAEEHPEHCRLIDDAMACDARVAVAAVVEGCGEVFEGVETLVDVGGGNGTSLSLLVQACPSIKDAINFDLPHVVSVAPQWQGVQNVGGDMFQSVPKADAVLLKWVLHDWNDEDCIKILKKCREAIPKDKGKVIIVEAIVADEDEEVKDKLEEARLMLDMVMLAHTNSGKERTSKEWDHILGESGFTRHYVRPIRAVQSVIVAFP